MNLKQGIFWLYELALLLRDKIYNRDLPLVCVWMCVCASVCVIILVGLMHAKPAVSYRNVFPALFIGLMVFEIIVLGIIS